MDVSCIPYYLRLNTKQIFLQVTVNECFVKIIQIVLCTLVNEKEIQIIIEQAVSSN